MAFVSRRTVNTALVLAFTTLEMPRKLHLVGKSRADKKVLNKPSVLKTISNRSIEFMLGKK
jgi:hypothetical protein